MSRKKLAQAIGALAAAITAACVSAQPRGDHPQGEWPVMPTATRPPTATPVPNYPAKVTRLLVPLGAMIVSARDRTATGLLHYQTFQEESGKIRTELEGDTSPQAITIRAAVSNIEAAWPLRDVATLERERRRLLDIRS